MYSIVLALPDGKQVAISLNVDEDKKSEIYVINIESGAQSNLTKTLGMLIRLQCSPEGKQIAFVSEQDAVVLDANSGLSTNNIYVMDADGTHLAGSPLIIQLVQYRFVSWSPDSKKLAVGMSSKFPSGWIFF